MLIESYFGPILKINNYEFINLYVEIPNNSLLPNLLSYFFEYDIKHKEAGFYLYMKDKNLLKGYNLINSVYYYNQYKRYIIEHSNNLYDSIDCDVYEYYMERFIHKRNGLLINLIYFGGVSEDYKEYNL